MPVLGLGQGPEHVLVLEQPPWDQDGRVLAGVDYTLGRAVEYIEADAEPVEPVAAVAPVDIVALGGHEGAGR